MQPNNTDIPKKLSEFSQLKGLMAGIFFLILGIIAAVVVDARSHKATTALLVFAGFFILSLIFILISVISYRQLRKAEKNPTTFNQFQTGTAVTYKTPLATAVVGQDEKVGSWLGPVTVGGKQGISYQVLSAEHDAQSVNTLIFTNKQIVAVLMGPQDLPSSAAGGSINKLATSAIKLSDESAVDKNVQFDALYSKKWQDIVDNVVSQGIQNITKQHLTYGIPYGNIQSISIKNAFINSGLTVHLKDGGKLTYNTLRKDLLTSVQSYLQQYVQIA